MEQFGEVRKNQRYAAETQACLGERYDVQAAHALRSVGRARLLSLRASRLAAAMARVNCGSTLKEV